MSHLLAEIGLRLAKVLVAGVVGVVLFAVLVGPFGVGATAELALLCWLSGAALILLLESSPL